MVECLFVVRKMKIAQGLLLAISIYITLLNSENVIEGRYAPSEYIAIGMFFQVSRKIRPKYYSISIY